MARRAWPASLLLVAIFAGCTSVGVHNPDLRRQIDFGANDYVALFLHLDEPLGEETGAR